MITQANLYLYIYMCVHIYMYKLYSVHVNDLSVCPEFPVQFSSSACPQLWSGDVLSPGSSAESLCLSLQGEGFGLHFPYPHAQKLLRVPTCLLSSPLVFCSLSEHVAPPPWLWGAAAFVGKCKAGSRPPLHVYWKLQTSARLGQNIACEVGLPSFKDLCQLYSRARPP